jgi:hypothetical protein
MNNKAIDTMNKQHPSNRWTELRKIAPTLSDEEVIIRIDDIDNDTLWQETEPKWWLEMMAFRRIITKAPLL